MKVYEVHSQMGRFQCFQPADQASTEAFRKATHFDGSPRKDGWMPPALGLLYPHLPRPDFWFIPPAAAFALERPTIEKIGHPILNAGEFLPLPFKGHALSLLNITQCSDALDTRNSVYSPGSHAGRPEKFAFQTHQIRSTLFKIPQTAASQILCAQWSGDPQEEFKAAVEHLGLTGVRFELLWEN